MQQGNKQTEKFACGSLTTSEIGKQLHSPFPLFFVLQLWWKMILVIPAFLKILLLCVFLIEEDRCPNLQLSILELKL